MERPIPKYLFRAEDIISEGRVTSEEISSIKLWNQGEDLPLLSDEQIILFLLSCENDQDVTKVTIKAHFDLKEKAPDIFINRVIKGSISEQHECRGEISLVPKLTEDRNVVMFFTFRKLSFLNWNFAKCIKQFCMCMDISLLQYPPQGLIIVADANHMNLGHVIKIRPMAMGVLFHYLQLGLPMKLKNLHLINAPSYIGKVLAIIHPFCSKEVIDRIICHPKPTNMIDFQEKWLSRDFLPEELQGTLPSLTKLHEDTIQKLIDSKEFFRDEELQRSN